LPTSVSIHYLIMTSKQNIVLGRNLVQLLTTCTGNKVTQFFWIMFGSSCRLRSTLINFWGSADHEKISSIIIVCLDLKNRWFVCETNSNTERTSTKELLNTVISKFSITRPSVPTPIQQPATANDKTSKINLSEWSKLPSKNQQVLEIRWKGYRPVGR
jgi:hypothetical protein